jgi:hypothetical protein
MKKAKLRVLSELKSKMITMLEATVREELGIEAEMESIEEEINDIIIKVTYFYKGTIILFFNLKLKELKKKAELEVNELV